MQIICRNARNPQASSTSDIRTRELSDPRLGPRIEGPGGEGPSQPFGPRDRSSKTALL